MPGGSWAFQDSQQFPRCPSPAPHLAPQPPSHLCWPALLCSDSLGGAFGHMPRLSPEVCSAGPGAPAPTPAILPCSHHRAGLSADRPWPWSMQTGSRNLHRPCWQKARQGRARRAQRQGMGGLERSGLAAVGDRACPCSVMGQVPPGRVSSCAWRASAGGVCRRQVAPCRMPSE